MSYLVTATLAALGVAYLVGAVVPFILGCCIGVGSVYCLGQRVR